ncbi:hypothetical protein [Kiloniella antarctica]|uniref:Methyltransferase domain-containing protein n=1 Tax=Kiloniella antarctica TaxID=1550907 RepID=A0ABW5BNV3_9PROT
MLSEALSYIFAKCQRKYRRLGYLKEAIAIEARHKRCKSAWADHLKKSQQEIINAVRKTKGRKRIVILGAGSGYDIPLKFLLSEFKEIHLVDVIFLGSIIKRAQKYPQIKLLERDVTGTIDYLFESGEAINLEKLNLTPPIDVLCGADLVISCNLMSQLPFNIRNKIQGLEGETSSEAIDLFCRSLILSHLNWLESCKATVLLLTDLEQHFVPRDHSKKKTDRENALFGLVIDKADQYWIWDIAPCPEVDKNYSLVHLVGSFYLQKKDKFQIR